MILIGTHTHVCASHPGGKLLPLPPGPGGRSTGPSKCSASPICLPGGVPAPATSLPRPWWAPVSELLSPATFPPQPSPQRALWQPQLPPYPGPDPGRCSATPNCLLSVIKEALRVGTVLALWHTCRKGWSPVPKNKLKRIYPQTKGGTFI